jgi:hypothetical protein
VTGDSLIARDARLGIIRITFAPRTAGGSPAHRDHQDAPNRSKPRLAVRRTDSDKRTAS